MHPSFHHFLKRISQILLLATLWPCFLLHAAEPVSSPPAAAKSQPDVLIYQGTYPGWPWVSRCPNGTLVCVWREGTQHGFSAVGRLMLSQSRDDGKRWSPAVTFLDVPGVDDRNVAIQCQTDSDWLVCYNSYAPEPGYTRDVAISRTLTLRTRDGGKTWSKPALVCTLDARTRSAPIRLSSGEWILPFYRAPGDQSLVARSQDDATTWEIIEIANAPGFVGDEWDVVELPDGRLLGIIRNSAPNPTPETRGWFYKTLSRDRGKTWSAAERTNLRDTRSTSPAQVFLDGGRPIVLYSDARMVSVAMASTSDPDFLKWDVEHGLRCYFYRPDGKPIVDSSYPVSVPIPGHQRFIVDYLHDGDLHAIAGYAVELPKTWGYKFKP